jgi:hypothetical protein
MGRLLVAYTEAVNRFTRRAAYVAHSRDGAAEFASDVYASWVLLTYAAYEASIQALGKAAVQHLGEFASSLSDLPDVVREAHIERTVRRASDALSRSKHVASDDPGSVEEILRGAVGPAWADESSLLRLDRNAWSVNVKDLLRRVGVGDSEMEWMRQTFGPSTETLESQVDRLVQERNDLAHGDLPTEIRSPELMIEQISAVQEFVRQSYYCLMMVCANAFPSSLSKELGVVNEAVVLAETTVGYLAMTTAVRVGDFVPTVSDEGQLRLTRVVSIQCSSESLDVVEPGHEHVAVTFSRPMRTTRAFECL